MVPRIIADPRTLNQTVVAHDGEITLNEAWKIAEKVTGEDFSDYYEVGTTFEMKSCQRLIIPWVSTASRFLTRSWRKALNRRRIC